MIWRGKVAFGAGGSSGIRRKQRLALGVSRCVVHQQFRSVVCSSRIALFGSTVRGEARPDSDVDIVVGFDGPATSERYFGVQFYLDDELGCAVDLVTEKALRPELKPYIEREAVDV